MKKWFKALFRRGRMPRAIVGDSSIELEQKFRESAVVHYEGAGKRISFNAEWLGWGEGQTKYLNVTFPEVIFAGQERLSETSVLAIAEQVSRGLLQLGIEHVIEQRLPAVRIPEEECEVRLGEVQTRVAALGWQVTYDRNAGTMGLSQVAGVEVVPLNELAVVEGMSQVGDWIRGQRLPMKTLVRTSGVKDVK